MIESKGLLFILFNLLVSVLLYIDLRSSGKEAKAISTKKAATWSAIWIGTALIFNLFILVFMGKEDAFAFLAGYVIEKSLSVDNIFVFIMIFSHFKISAEHQPRILKWGILGAIVMRAAFIFLGIGLLEVFHWTIYIFGAILIVTGLKMAFKKEDEDHLEQGFLLKNLRKYLPLTPKIHGNKFIVLLDGKKYITPLFLALVTVELSDLIFAFDSIPAILAITTDPFLAYTSNIFAILGLRALFFLIAGIMGLFRFLKIGISVILIFVGIKMISVEFFHITTAASLLVILSILVVSIAASKIYPDTDVENQ